MQQGIVKWFDEQKGYGFITPDDGSRDVFCHYSAIDGTGHRTLREGQRVEFELGESKKTGKIVAIIVRPI